jgi:hypothetical protein
MYASVTDLKPVQQHDDGQYDTSDSRKHYKIKIGSLQFVEGNIDLDMDVVEADYGSQAAAAVDTAQHNMQERANKTKEVALRAKQIREREQAAEDAKKRKEQEDNEEYY